MSKIDKLFSQFESKLNDRFRSDRTFREAKYKQIFIDSDPTANKKYLRWILDSYVNNGIQRFEDLYGRVPDALEDYDYLVTSKKLSKGVKGEAWTNETVIDNFCGLAGCTKKGNEKMGLDDLLDKYYDIIEKRREKGEELENVTAEREIICENDYFKIIHPMTEKASCYYGAGTKWCTAAKSRNQFRHYSKLYIIIPKQPEYNGEKYQLSYKDQPVDLKEMMDNRIGFKECVIKTMNVVYEGIMYEDNNVVVVDSRKQKGAVNLLIRKSKSKLYGIKHSYLIISKADDNYYYITVDNFFIDINVYDSNFLKIDIDELLYTNRDQLVDSIGFILDDIKNRTDNIDKYIMKVLNNPDPDYEEQGETLMKASYTRNDNDTTLMPINTKIKNWKAFQYLIIFRENNLYDIKEYVIDNDPYDYSESDAHYRRSRMTISRNLNKEEIVDFLVEKFSQGFKIYNEIGYSIFSERE